VDEIAAIAKELGTTSEKIVQKIDALHEFNPMLGHRGCRLAVTFPEIAEMQTRAVLQAALKVRRENKINVKPEIMIPLVSTVKELRFVKQIVLDTAEQIFKEAGERMDFQVGTMIEIPRACVVADKIALEAEFFSFGTNDLTQMGFGFSRDDAGKFLDAYYATKILESDPFARLDQEGIGELVKMAVEKGRQARKGLKLGICGEHGGDPSTIEFCHHIGLDYVSCSPYRVPIARLAAAHAAIKEKKAK
jgi:pyruvate,orthophosphate dikinase